MRNFPSVFVALSTCLGLLPAVTAAPPGIVGALEPDQSYSNQVQSSGGSSEASKRQSKPELRILPLGASIVWGYQSSTGNGFRKPLRDQLRFKGWSVDMVGSKQNGNFIDKDVEANPGDIIDQIHAASKNSYGYKPNVVLVNGGTNDAIQGVDIVNAGARMESLITDIWSQSGMENTLIVLSTVLPTTNSNGAANRGSINQQYKNLVTKLRNAGKPIIGADMDYLQTSDLSSDGIHPLDPGYAKMAYVWWVAIENAYTQGLISTPTPFDPNNSPTCANGTVGSVYAGGLTQKGSGNGDGIYYHNSQEMGIVLSITSDYDRNQWFFTRLYGRTRDDLVGWFNNADGSQAFGVWRNTGASTNMYTKINDLKSPSSCDPAGLHWVDLNADGYDDWVCVDSSGNLYGAVNNKDGTTSNPPSFTYLGLIKSSEGYSQDRIRLADIDGDGRCDYCIVNDGGNVRCWRNGGVGNTPAYWEDLGIRMTNQGLGEIAGIRFEDINGDGRDDYMWMNDVGVTYTWTNARSCQIGQVGDGLNVAWRQGYFTGASSGWTHGGMGSYGSSGLRNRIHFARVYGKSAAFGLLGRQDYVFMQHTLQSDGKHRFDVRVWQNIGSGATKLESDGDRYCNMQGNSKGAMDYVWIWSTGAMVLYPNLGKTSISGDETFWGTSQTIWDPTTQSIGKQLDRRDLHLVDWDGDGLCDIVWVDPDNQNRVKLWVNNYKRTGGWNWGFQDNPAPDLHCPETRGVGLFDLPVQFGDISGSGRGDYLCMEKDGRSWGYQHNADGSWEYIDQFKSADGRDRANLRFADVDGDGRDDMIWTDKFQGVGWVYHNNGRKDTGGSRYEWIKPSAASYTHSTVAGTCAYYPDLDGDGRADQHSILGTWSNQAETWFNRCGALRDATGDDANMGDPGFPPLP